MRGSETERTRRGVAAGLIRRTVAAGALALALGALCLVSTGRRISVPTAQAFGACPVPLKIGRPATSGTVDTFITATLGGSEFWDSFPNTWTTFGYYTDTAAALAALRGHDVDLVITDRPLRPSQGESSGMYAFRANAATVGWTDVWVVTNDKNFVSRVDDSRQVRADDYVNFTRGAVGVWLEALGGLNPPQYAVPDPIPDYDVNLDGGTHLGDLLNVAQRWGAGAYCPGWIRPDENNSGSVSLGDVGGVEQHWGADGLLYPSDDPTQAWRVRTLGEYGYEHGDCTAGSPPQHPDEGDPVTLILIGSPPNEWGHFGYFDVLGAQFEDDTYFRSGANGTQCEVNDFNEATAHGLILCDWGIGGILCLPDRMHARGHTNTAVWDPDFPHKFDQALTPHFSKTYAHYPLDNRPFTDTGCSGGSQGEGTHVVEPHVNQDPSKPDGYSFARDDVYPKLLGIHDGWIDLGGQFWGNIDFKYQCSGDIVTRSDGYVHTLLFSP